MTEAVLHVFQIGGECTHRTWWDRKISALRRTEEIGTPEPVPGRMPLSNLQQFPSLDLDFPLRELLRIPITMKNLAVAAYNTPIIIPKNEQAIMLHFELK